MLQNVKVDVVYFSKASDFEMEFNLCGCCRMRLLTEKGDGTVKRFVENLATAVSRSRVIIACGPITGENSIIKTVATAINAPLSKTDNAAFGISSSENIEIIEGSLPLVTSESVFGGCVIESGPQSIILLTEDKAIRKNLMKNLIHPYIADLSVSSQNESSYTLKTEEERLAEEITEQLSADENEESANTQEPASEQNEGIDEADAVQETLPIFENGETFLKPEEPENNGTVDETAAEAVIEQPAEKQEPEIKESEKSEPQKQSGSVRPKGEIEFIMDPEPTAPLDFSLGAAENGTGFITGDERNDFVPEISNACETPKKEKSTFAVKPDFPVSEERSDEPLKNSKGINVTILVICVILIICLAMTAVLLIGIPAARNQDVMSYIKEIFTSSSSSV